MRGWQLIELGLVVTASAMLMARQYLRSDVKPTRPGLSLRDETPLLAPPGAHEQMVARVYRGIALFGGTLVVVGGVLLATEPAPPPKPPPPMEPIPVRMQRLERPIESPSGQPGNQ